MCALRLECFTNTTPADSEPISLFDAFASEKDMAFSKGVKSGANAASKAYEAEKIRSLAPILEAINDMNFSLIESRHSALNSFQPLLKALLDTTLPAAASAGFSAEIVARVMGILEKLPDEVVIVQVPGDCVSAVTQMLSVSSQKCEVVVGDELGPLQARVSWKSGFESIDVGAVIAALDSAVQEFFETEHFQKAGDLHA